MKTTRVLIIDRDSMSSDLLAGGLSREQQFEAVPIRQSELVRALSTEGAQVVVIAVDAHANPSNSFEIAVQLYHDFPATFVVMLLNQDKREFVIKSFHSGARGVFSRQSPMSEFKECVARVAKGHLWAGKWEAAALLEAFSSMPSGSVLFDEHLNSLTARELEVVQCAAKGLTNKLIGRELRLSEHTVKNYLFRAFEKLGVSNRVELLFKLTQRGMLSDKVRASPVLGTKLPDPQTDNA